MKKLLLLPLLIITSFCFGQVIFPAYDTSIISDKELKVMPLIEVLRSEGYRGFYKDEKLKKKYELDGWASIEKNIYDKCKFKKFNQMKVITRKLDYYKFKNIGFIKIDVEGHELSLLRGAIKFFKKNKPDCLIEIKTENLNLSINALFYIKI